MADVNMFQEVGGKFVETIFSGIIWFGLLFIAVAVVGGLMYFFLIYKKKFDITVKIISERAGDKDRIIFDKAAILKDRKSQTPYFRIWGLKLDLTAPKFNVLQTTNRGDYLELYRVSETDIYFLTPTQIDKTKILKADGKIYTIAEQSNKLIDTDISFWSTKRKSMNTKMFDTESLLMKVLPYIPHIMGGVIMIFILYMLLDHLPGILSELRELTKELRSLKGADVVYGLLLAQLKCQK